MHRMVPGYFATVRRAPERRPSMFDRAVKRTYSAPTHSISRFRMITNAYNSIYWSIRSFQFWLCYKQEDIAEDDDEEIIVRETPPPLQALVESTRFSPDEIKYFYRAFHDSLDIKNSVLEERCQSKSSRAFFGCFPAASSLDFAERIFAAFDLNDAGYLTFEKLLTCLSNLCRGTKDEQAVLLHRIMDVKRDLFLDNTDYREYIQSVFDLAAQPRNSEKISSAAFFCLADSAFKKLDYDSDGLISIADVENFYLNLDTEEDSLVECLRTIHH